MVGEIAAQHALPQDVVERVSERTGGVPLFVEEVTRLLVERGEQGGVQAIPPTLQQSLAARLDRLGPAREVAQVGAVLGRDFVYALLRDVAEIDEPALQASLERLADADLLFVEGAPPEAKYRFKHALIQDAAYDSLLKSRRQTLHLVPTRANGQLAFGVYLVTPDGTRRGVGLTVLTLAGDRICGLTRFESESLSWFGLPRTLST